MVNDELITALALLFVQSVRSRPMLRTRNRFARIVLALPTMFPQRRNGQVLPVPTARWCFETDVGQPMGAHFVRLVFSWCKVRRFVNFRTD